MKLAGAVVWAAGAAVSLWAAQQPPQFRSSVETVAVYATVRDNHGQLVRGLTQEDFELFDNSQRRDIVAFSNDLQPTTVAMVLDSKRQPES